MVTSNQCGRPLHRDWPVPLKMVCEWRPRMNLWGMVCTVSMLMLIGLAVVRVDGAGAAEPPSSRPPEPPPVMDPAEEILRPAITRASILAEVNGVNITYGELEDAIFEQIPNVTGHGTISQKRLRERAAELLHQLIRTELLVQEADRVEVTADQRKVNAEIQRQRNSFHSEAEFQRVMEQRGLTLGSFRRRIDLSMRIQELITREVDQKVTVTDADLAAYYEEHPEKFILPEQYRLRVLLLRVDPGGLPEMWDRERERAAELKTRVQQGEQFTDFIQQYSDDLETKERGGDTGLVHQGQLGLPELEHAVEVLQPGEITDPVRTLYGYYLARVEEKRPSRQQTFEEVNKELFRQELMQAKRRERYQEWFAEVMSRATITRYPIPVPAPE